MDLSFNICSFLKPLASFFWQSIWAFLSGRKYRGYKVDGTESLAPAGKCLPGRKQSRQRHAAPAEPVAVTVVKRRRVLLNYGDVHRHRADAIDVAGFVPENFPDPAIPINPAGDAVVGAADERQIIFHRAKDGIGHVLPLLGALPEPAIVGQVYQKIRVITCRVACEFREDILKTNQRRSFDGLARRNTG